jgi:hypothetical protein
MTVQNITRELIVAIRENVGLHYNWLRDYPLDRKSPAIDLRPDVFNHHTATPLNL